jgi:Rod binding domain-containing protein
MMPSVDAVPAFVSTGERTPNNVHQAARQFEGMLLASLLQSFQKTFSSIPGDEKDCAHSQYEYMEAEAVGSALASRGGIGLAGLIEKCLQK